MRQGEELLINVDGSSTFWFVAHVVIDGVSLQTIGCAAYDSAELFTSRFYGRSLPGFGDSS
ncbi:MAG: hypothetical protein WBO24_02285 [Nitrospirales bacterium]